MKHEKERQETYAYEKALVTGFYHDLFDWELILKSTTKDIWAYMGSDADSPVLISPSNTVFNILTQQPDRDSGVWIGTVKTKNASAYVAKAVQPEIGARFVSHEVNKASFSGGNIYLMQDREDNTFAIVDFFDPLA